jgi:hypothetical protein
MSPCLYVCVPTHAHTHTHTHTRTRTRTRTRTHTHTHTHTHICVHVRMLAHIRTHLHVSIHIKTQHGNEYTKQINRYIHVKVTCKIAHFALPPQPFSLHNYRPPCRHASNSKSPGKPEGGTSVKMSTYKYMHACMQCVTMVPNKRALACMCVYFLYVCIFKQKCCGMPVRCA